MCTARFEIFMNFVLGLYVCPEQFKHPYDLCSHLKTLPCATVFPRTLHHLLFSIPVRVRLKLAVNFAEKSKHPPRPRILQQFGIGRPSFIAYLYVDFGDLCEVIVRQGKRQTLQIEKYGTAGGLSTKNLEQYLKNKI